jgi:3-hydroxypropanoate dehydrogenase
MVDSSVPDRLDDEHEHARDAVRALRREIREADPATLRLLLTEARTHNGWNERDVTETELRRLWDIAKQGPTASNQQPLRIVFVRSPEAKLRLKPALSAGNAAKTMGAPVVAILGYDLEFWRHMGKLFPHRPEAHLPYRDDPNHAQINAIRNGTLQAAYFIIAARAIGLDCGPMSGFDHVMVDRLFFTGSSVRSNFLCSLGHGDETKIFRALPRLDFDEVARIL